MHLTADNIPCIVVETNKQGDIKYINNYGKELLPKKSFSHFMELLTKGSAIYYETYLYTCFKPETEKNEIFLTISGKDGKLPVLFTIKMSSDEDNSILFVGMLIKARIEKEKKAIEAKKNAERENRQNKNYLLVKKNLEIKQKQLEYQLRNYARRTEEQIDLNKILSHDLQEPIRKISTFVSLLNQNDETKNKIYKEKIVALSIKSRKLIIAVQEYLQLEEKFNPIYEIDIEDILKKIIPEKTSLNVLNPDKLKFVGDLNQIQKLFTELFKNSIQHVVKSKTPNISIEVDEIEKNSFVISKNLYDYKNFIRFRYTDNSVGFAKEYADKVMHLFQKLDNTDRVGLGLSYCKKIVELHGGDIYFHHINNKSHEIIITIPTEIEVSDFENEYGFSDN